jgi:hypothetical protein
LTTAPVALTAAKAINGTNLFIPMGGGRLFAR